MHGECHEFRADPELAIRRGYSHTTKIMLLIRLSTPILSRTIFSLSSLEEVPAVAISTPVDVVAILFDTRPHPTRCGLENSAIYAPSGRALALV